MCGVVVVVGAEASPRRCRDVQQVCLFVPGVGVDVKIDSSCFESKGAVLGGHADETGASRAALVPKDQRVVVGVALGVEKDVMEAVVVEVEHAWVGEEVPEYHLCSV